MHFRPLPDGCYSDFKACTGFTRLARRAGMRAALFHPTTGYSLPRDTRYMASLGLCGFLQKPFESGHLSQMLYDVMHDRISASQYAVTM